MWQQKLQPQPRPVSALGTVKFPPLHGCPFHVGLDAGAAMVVDGNEATYWASKLC